MAESDWTEATDGLADAVVVRGVSSAFTPPNGGGSFIWGGHSLQNTPGVVAYYYSAGSGFAPTIYGGEINGALIHSDQSSGLDKMSGFFFQCLGGTSVNGNAYMLGLSPSNPSNLILCKRQLALGIPDDVVGSSGVLARSTATIAPGTWKHIRWEVVVNASGDVFHNVQENDLTVNAVTSPVWVDIDGLNNATGGVSETAFVDDALGALSGSAPYTAGRMGKAIRTDDIGRVVMFDEIQVIKQD